MNFFGNVEFILKVNLGVLNVGVCLDVGASGLIRLDKKFENIGCCNNLCITIFVCELEESMMKS